ncbi:hypothetical protein EV2_045516 [Malus domestica]
MTSSQSTLSCTRLSFFFLFLFEYRGAKLLIMEQFLETAASIVSFKVDSDVVSLNDRDFLEIDAEIDDDGKLHVKVPCPTHQGSRSP